MEKVSILNLTGIAGVVLIFRTSALYKELHLFKVLPITRWNINPCLKLSNIIMPTVTVDIYARYRINKAVIRRENKANESVSIALPKRIARRTLRGSSKKVCFGDSGVTIFPDFRSAMPEKYVIN